MPFESIVYGGGETTLKIGGIGAWGYSREVTNGGCAFVAPYLALCQKDSEQRENSPRVAFNELR